MTEPLLEAELEIQWESSDACLTLHCLCGAESHFDIPNVESIPCRACGIRYFLERVMTLRTFELPAAGPCQE